jgi:F0F1-type ATP synthase assembly protein I
MGSNLNQVEKRQASNALNLTLAAVAGQVGCLTLVIVLVALFGGLWLDKQLDTKPAFTIGLMIISVPITLILMFWVVKKATSKINDGIKDLKVGKQEENQGGKIA